LKGEGFPIFGNKDNVGLGRKVAEELLLIISCYKFKKVSIDTFLAMFYPSN